MSDENGDDDQPARHDRRRARQRPERNYAPRERRTIDAAQLRELALGYAARYATTAAKLQRYLERKLHERDWTTDEPVDVAGLVAHIVALGYVDDRAYATAKQRELTARGYGVGRVRQSLAAAGVSRDDVSDVISPLDGAAAEPFGAAIAFARRRRFGPFSRTGRGPEAMRRELAAMARAGHGFDVARRVLMAPDEAAVLRLLDD